jgi:hypothetical protein
LDGKEVWATCTDAVYSYVKNNFKGWEEVTLQYEKQGNFPYVTRIEKGSGKDVQNSSVDSKPVCEDCGKELKDDKYTKCYTCNKKSPTTKSLDSQDAINRQNANHATSRALIALQGHINPNNIMEMIDALHARFMEKITG